LTRDHNPYTNQTPVRILEREVLRSEISTLSGGYTDVSCPFFYKYQSIGTCPESMVKAAASFKYIRFKRIVYRVLFTGNPFIYGAIFLTCQPKTDFRDAISNAPETMDGGWASGSDSIMLDVSTQQECEIGIDWPFPFTWIPTEWMSRVQAAPSIIQNTLYLRIMVYNPIKKLVSTSSTAINMQVYCRMEGVEVAGPQHVPLPAEEFELLGESQGDAAAIPPAWQNERPAPVVSTLLSAASAGATMLGVGGAIAGGFTKPTFLTGNDVEIGPILQGLGNSTPASTTSTVSQNRVIQDLYGSVLYPENSQVLADGGLNVPSQMNMSVIDYCRTPSLLYWGELDTDIHNFLVEPTHEGRPANVSRLGAMSKFYRFWRGSINYTFVLVCSPLVSFRVLFQLRWGSYTEMAPITDVISKVVTIRGTTSVNITVPYLMLTPYVLTGTIDGLPSLYYKVMSYSSGVGDVTPVLQYYVYETPGPDFEFSSMKVPQKTYAPGPVPKKGRVGRSQARVSSFVALDWIAEGQPGPSYAREEMGTFADLVKRWTVRTDLFGSAAPMNHDYNWTRASNIDILASLFLFWKGQTKRKNFYDWSTLPPSTAYSFVRMQSNSAVGGIDNLPDHLRFGDGMVIANRDKTQVVEYTVPYLSTTEWHYTNALEGFANATFPLPALLFDPLLGQFDTQDGIEAVAMAAGDDFSFRYPLPPPRIHRWQEM
jgi:hypothetical protein